MDPIKKNIVPESSSIKPRNLSIKQRNLSIKSGTLFSNYNDMRTHFQDNGVAASTTTQTSNGKEEVTYYFDKNGEKIGRTRIFESNDGKTYLSAEDFKTGIFRSNLGDGTDFKYMERKGVSVTDTNKNGYVDEGDYTSSESLDIKF